MDREPASQRAVGMDVGFLVLLFLTGLTGLVLLALRATPAMGTLLAFHLGIGFTMNLGTLPAEALLDRWKRRRQQSTEPGDQAKHQ